MTTPDPRVPSRTPLLREATGLLLLAGGLVGLVVLAFLVSPMLGAAATCTGAATVGALLTLSEV